MCRKSEIKSLRGVVGDRPKLALRDGIKLYFGGPRSVCEVCGFHVHIQGFPSRKLLEFGLKTRCPGGTLKETKIFGLFI